MLLLKMCNIDPDEIKELRNTDDVLEGTILRAFEDINSLSGHLKNVEERMTAQEDRLSLLTGIVVGLVILYFFK